MKILGDRILVEPFELETGIIAQLPQDGDKTPKFGRVKALGTGSKIDPLIQPGCTVLIDDRYGSHKTGKNGDAAFIVSVSDVMAVVEKLPSDDCPW